MSGSVNDVTKGQTAPSGQKSSAVNNSRSLEEDKFNKVDVLELLERIELRNSIRTNKQMEHIEKLFNELRQAFHDEQLKRDAAKNVRKERQDRKEEEYLEALYNIARKLN